MYGFGTVGRDGHGKTVFVGLSGGVDSSVAALRLLKRGYSVVGVFIKTWHPDFLPCTWCEERRDAMRVAAYLNIPFLTFDAEDVYRREVAEYFIDEYRAGRVPNPDVMCNRAVKFGAFLAWARREGADFVATGHYAQIEKGGSEVNEPSTYRLLRGADRAKDQSYFLWMLTQHELAHTLFPIGASTKVRVRREARRAGLLTATKRDSQGICFLGKVDLKEFLSRYIETEQGNVLNARGGVIGRHDGALYYTLGQRHGFTLDDRDTNRTPHYVISKDMDANTITVSSAPPEVAQEEQVHLANLNEIAPPPAARKLTVQFRYRQEPISATLAKDEDGTATLIVPPGTERPALGQSAVLYDGTECLGGGIIT
jgi:tRNA-specific 2-thiouridylase